MTNETPLEVARRQLGELIGAHVDGCQDSDADYRRVVVPITNAIDRLVDVATLDQTETIITLIDEIPHYKNQSHVMVALEKERDRLLAEMERKEKHGD